MCASSPDHRAELLTHDVDPTEDHAASVATLQSVWSIWQCVPGTLLIPGHDLTMRLNAAGQPEYVGALKVSIAAWFDEDLRATTVIELTQARVCRKS